jgi:diguanylate cyclase (GGDEF)-like protein
MSQSSEAQSAQSAPAKPPLRRRVLTLLILLAEAGGFVGLMTLLLRGRLMYALEVLQLMLAFALPLVVMGTVAARRNRWHEPFNRLLDLLPRVRAGEEPIESLSTIGGHIAPLAAICQDLIRDFRLEQTRIAELEQELERRMAKRAETLERRIGVLQQQAARDPLTGLFNRRALDAFLPEAIARCRAASQPLCVLMIDIDHFKPLNDSLGHAAGDQMLKSLAQIIRSTLRDTDAAFRNGGDEFVVVLESCADETATTTADRLVSLGGNLGRTFRVPHPPCLSIGMAKLADVPNADAPALIRAADRALYQVKASHHAQLPPSPKKLSA